jgi:acyl carrier protein
MSVRSQILEQFIQVAQEQNKPLVPLDNDVPLLNSGLDSLCLAVIVARLEDVLHIDPFSTYEDAAFPVTVGDFVRFYENSVASSGLEVPLQAFGKNELAPRL